MRKLIYTLAFVLIVHCTFNIEDCMSQWQPDVRLTNDPAVSSTSMNNTRCVASSGSAIHVVWFDQRDGNEEIYYKRSTDAGANWGTDTRLTNNTAFSTMPSVAVSGSVVHIVWQDYRDGNREIYYKHSTDAGVNWGADTRLTNNTANSEYPSIAVSGSVVHIVWQDYRDGNYEIYYKRSTNAGVNWEADTQLTNNTAESNRPSVTVSGSVVHVVWSDYRDGNTEIYYERSTDAGVNWGTDTRLTNNTASSSVPNISVSGSVVHVVWSDKRDGNNGEIYYKRSTDAGVSWGTDIRLTNNTAFSYSPSIAVSDSVVHVVWVDRRDGDSEIYYKRSIDSGVIWGTDTRLTNATANSDLPSITVSGSVLHVVWYDWRDGNQEIYYKRDPTGNLTGLQNISTEIPSAYSLGQNYPNPFNPTTKIKFDIASVRQASLLVTLKIYDVMGREVQTLVNESLKPGTYEATFDASQLTSGVYFYRITTESFSDTKKMLMIK